MYDLTNKKFEMLPEVMRRKEEERKREEYRIRQEKARQLHEV